MLSCSKEPVAIHYGTDACDFCRMTIVDNIHATELITSKGKAYKFDSFECLLHYQRQHPEETYAHEVTNTFEAPNELFPASKATFLISENLPSPMNGNITAFKSKTAAEAVQAEKKGKLYTLEELKNEVK